MQTLDEFGRGTSHVEDRDHLAARLRRGDRLRIKWGVDPTAPDLHLGHTVPMRRLRAWQDAGHLPVIIIGDWTARIGDPTGRNEARPPLGAGTVERNAQTYLEQLFTILDRGRTEVRRQSEWFDGLGLEQILRLTAGHTVQQLLQRSDFSERAAAGRAIGVHELLYPLLQGYDSVAVRADVELGGTDQLFNLLAARDVQRHHGDEPQDVVTVPLIEGTDGVRKMSKSYGNAIGVADPPAEQFGRVMSIPDPLIVKYLTLVTDTPAAEVERVERGLAGGGLNPRDAKAQLARSIVTQFHGAEAAARAAEEFDRVHARGGLPDEMPEVELPSADAGYDAVDLVDLLLRRAGTPRSRSEIRRLLEQEAVEVVHADGRRTALRSPGPPIAVGEAVAAVPGDEPSPGRDAGGSGSGPPLRLGRGDVLRVGRRLFVRVAAAP